MRKLTSKIEILTQDEMQMIHDSAVDLVEKTGFYMPNAECLKRCEKKGCIVDYDKEVVKVPADIMNDFVKKFRNRPQESMDDINKICGGISTQIFITDYKTKTKRLGTSDDIMRGIELVKHLDNIPGCQAVTIPSDVDSRITDLHSYNMIYKYSKKDGGTYVINTKSANYIMDMAEAKGQKTGYLFETISPLKFRKETLEMGLAFADRGHYLYVAPMIMGGSTGPITMAGTLTLITAEVLVSLFSVHAITDTIGGFFGHGSHTTDPKTMLCSFGSPNQALIGIGSSQMAKFYGIHSGSNSALSDSLMPDFQCGFEKTFSALFSLLSGSCSIGCQGIAGADQGFSFEQLVIDNEWLDAYNYVIQGYEVTRETIALELMHEVGIGGNFLAEEHTVEHMADSWWKSKLFDRYSFESWIESGAVSLLDKASEMVDNYSRGYKDMPLAVDEKTADELDRIYYKGKADILAD